MRHLRQNICHVSTRLSLFLTVAVLFSASWGLAQSDRQYTLGSVLMVADLEWFRTVQFGMEAAAQEHGATVLVGNAQGQVDVEANTVDNFVARGVDAILISALDSTASVPALQRAVDSGIVLVNYNTTINSPIMTHFVGVSNYELGAQMGRYVLEYVNEHLDGTAEIALLTIPRYEVGIQRRDGFVDAISVNSDIRIVTEQEGEVPEQAANTLEIILQANPNIDLVWAANEGGTVGAITALRSRPSDVRIFGTDMSLQIADALLDQVSGVVAVSTQDPYNIGYQAVEVAIQRLDGEIAETEVIAPLLMYESSGPEAVQEYLEQFRELAN